ncbi:thioredoxin [Halobacteriales archaeon QS_3_64_16]|nr:MAG: thioredoxin [Halobacteriales archaeon QS_3_64_16]
MSERTDAADGLDAIRKRKLDRLQSGADSSATSPAGSGEVPGGEESRPPTEPVAIEDEDSFRSLLEEYDIVLADFSATWCGPCQMLEPIVERVAADSPGAVATIDIDANPDLAQQCSVRSVPTLLVFADGEPVERLLGVQDEAILADLIEQYA